MSAAVSSHYTVACRTCGAGPKEPCRTLTTGRVTDTHLPRIRDQYPQCPRCPSELVDGRCTTWGCGAA